MSFENTYRNHWAIREPGETASSIAKLIYITQPAVSLSFEKGNKVVEEMGSVL